MTLTSRTVNSGVVTGNVPNEGGTKFLLAKLPASASIGTIIRKRPINIANPRVVLNQYVFADIPANADPLFPVAEVNAYRISESPCGPTLFNCEVPKPGERTETAVSMRMIKGKMSTYSIDIFTSYDSIFLPRYSGVRPTIKPAIKTDITTKMSMP